MQMSYAHKFISKYLDNNSFQCSYMFFFFNICNSLKMAVVWNWNM